LNIQFVFSEDDLGLAVIHYDHETGTLKINRIPDVHDIDVLADNKDVIVADDQGKVRRITPSTDQESVIFNLGEGNDHFESWCDTNPKYWNEVLSDLRR
jgi:hypothetical protein